MTVIGTDLSWHDRARALKIQGHAFIDGQYVPAVSGEQFDCISPIDGKVIARVASTDRADVDRAVAAARRAFERGVWSRQPPRERKRVLQRFAELILQHKEELALLETIDMGKPISDSLAVDIPSTARCIAWYAEAVDKVYDEVAPTPHDALALITREPIGVVAAIVPWNFPLIMAAWKIGPALAAGNSFILKPSEKSPLTAIRLAALATEAGIPPGVFNVLPGYGHTAGQALALHMDVDCIGFTGSTRTGKLMLQYSGQSNMIASGWSAAASRPTSSSPMRPTSMRPRPRPAPRSSSTRARCAPPHRASWWRRACATACSKACWPWRSGCRPAIRSIRRRASVPSSTRCRPGRCSATSSPGVVKARGSSLADSARASTVAAATSSRPSSRT